MRAAGLTDRPELHVVLATEQWRALREPEAQGAFVLEEEGAVAVVVLEGVEGRAWLLGVAGEPGAALDPLLTQVEALGRALGPGARLLSAGPPSAYLRSGHSPEDPLLRTLLERGWSQRSEHVDLRVRLRPPAEPDARVRRVQRPEVAQVVGWAQRHFGVAWAREWRRALVAHESLWVAGEPGAYLGAVAHSGHNAVLGTFGPLGVAPEARQGGLGAALARTALEDLSRQGFSEATIPWVDRTLVRFYEPLVARCTAEPRVLLSFDPA